MHRLAPKLSRMSRRDQVAALRYLIRQLGDIDGVIVPHHRDWHVDAIDMYARGMMRRLQLAAADEREGIRRGALREVREIHETLGREIRGMVLVAELDRVSGRSGR